MGLNGLAWVEQHAGYDAYVITHDDLTSWTDRFARYRSHGTARATGAPTATLDR